MPKFLVDGAELKCTMGTSSGSFKVLSSKVKGSRKPKGNKLDCIPMANIPSFGTCKVTKFPCIPATTPWNTSSNVKVRGAPAINESCSTMCALGGKVSISDPGQSVTDNAGG